MSINWGAVQTAAATSVVVTMVVEYFAKPRLEARKERHLESLRTRRAFMAALTELQMAAVMFTGELPGRVERRLRENLQAERDRQYARLRARVVSLFDEAGKFAAAYREPLLSELMDYVSCLYGVVLSTRSKHRQAEIIMELGPAAAAVFEPPIWRPIAFMNARERLQAAIADTKVREGDTETRAPVAGAPASRPRRGGWLRRRFGSRRVPPGSSGEE